MHKSIKTLSFLAILAVPLIALPAHATDMNAGSPPTPHSNWRAQHEDMENVRSDREELQGQIDRLKEQCMDAKGQARMSCDAKGADLRQRQLAMHDKMETVHEKRAVMHEEGQHKKWKEHKASMKKDKMAAPGKAPAKMVHKKKAAPAPAPAGDPAE